MRVVVVLFVIALFVHVAGPTLAATEDAAVGSLSGTNADTERTMQGVVDVRGHDRVVEWLRANPHRDLTLRLDSPGGSAKYGVLLHDAIVTHGRVATDVGPGQACLSACTYIWLAGQVRTMGDRAQLGFHSAFCRGPCDTGGLGYVNQLILDGLARTEPTLAVLLSRTGAMITGNHRVALAHRENGRWAMRIYDPPTTVSQR